MRHKGVLIAAILIVVLVAPAAALDINSTSALRYFPGSQMEFEVDTAGNLNLTGDNITDINNIENFFDQTKCGTDEAVKTVYPNGSYECSTISGTAEAENLSETLGAGNKLGSYNIDTEDQNLTSSTGNVTVGTDLKVYGDIWTRGDPPANSLSEVLNEGNTASTKIDMNGYNISNIDNLEGFFDQSKCADDEAIKTVYPNGSYECNTISSDQSVENLADTLSAGNFSNGTDIYMNGSSSIRYSNGVKIGRDASTIDSEDVAIGINATADPVNPGGGWTETVVGYNAAAAPGGSAFGSNSYAHNSGVAIGDGSDSGLAAIAIGSSASASANYATAIGYNANAPNAYEATFGNLNGEELDVNVTGNATVHQNMDVKGDLNVGGELTGVSAGGSTENLSETLAAGNIANQTIEFSNAIEIGDGSVSTYDSDDIAIGKDATTSDIGNQIAIGGGASVSGSGKGIAIGGTSAGALSMAIGGSTSGGGDDTALGVSSSASGTSSTAVGADADASGTSSVALGRLAESTAQNSVAIGYNANAPNAYEATFGNLNGQELDVNVTGNATIHGNIATGSNTQSGLSSGDINASDIYYNTLTAKSPVVQCSQGTDWCKVSEPSKQDSYFVKVDESFDKDRPRKTAEKVVESDAETVKRFEELREENERQEEKIQQLNSTVQALKSSMCEEDPGMEVCSK